MTLIRITPNIEKAKSIYKMAHSTLDMLKDIDKIKYPSNIIKEYYDIIRELAGVILLLDGYRLIGENLHKEAFEYLKKNYDDYFRMDQLHLIDSLRILRNDISYDGFFVDKTYLDRVEKDILILIKSFDKLISEKL